MTRIDLTQAVNHLAEKFDDHVAHDVAVHFSCSEVDALVYLFLAAGQDEAALRWIKAHAENPDEEEGDLHFEIDPA